MLEYLLLLIAAGIGLSVVLSPIVGFVIAAVWVSGKKRRWWVTPLIIIPGALWFSWTSAEKDSWRLGLGGPDIWSHVDITIATSVVVFLEVALFVWLYDKWRARKAKTAA